VEIRTYPDPCLLEETEEVREVDDEIRALARDMLETMYAGRGIGLAAPQVGVLRRLIVLNPGARPGEGEEIVLVNPELLEHGSDIVEEEEGCLSLPGLTGVVPRFQNVRVRGLDLEGRERVVEGADLLARVLQHEMDHLEGVLFITKVGPVDRAALKPKLKEMKAKAR
jgi:peptide deformylase